MKITIAKQTTSMRLRDLAFAASRTNLPASLAGLYKTLEDAANELDVSVHREELPVILADIRNMFPMPSSEGNLKDLWSKAMNCPESVPAYVEANLTKMYQTIGQLYATCDMDAAELTKTLQEEIAQLRKSLSDAQSTSKKVVIVKAGDTQQGPWQKFPNNAWCVGCNPSNCSGCNTARNNKENA